MNLRKFEHDFSDSQIIDLFQRAMEAQGFIFDGDESWVSMDGKTHYVKVQNNTTKNKIKKSAWYKGYLDDFPAGTFGWFHGNNDSFSWSLWAHCKENNISVQQRQITKEEQEARDKEYQRQQKAKEHQAKEQALLAELISKIEIHRSLPLQPHPYLDKKKLDTHFAGQWAKTLNPTPFTAKEVRDFIKEQSPSNNKNYIIEKIMDYQENHMKYRKGYMIISGFNLDFEIVFYQMIASSKNKFGIDKWFPKNFPKHETFGLIGPQFNEESTSVIICEGWATALSIAKFINFSIPVIIAWDSGNMQAVALSIRARYRSIKIWSANDNDHTKLLKDNAGIQGGLKVSAAVGCYLVPPDFDPQNPMDEKNTDWNDMELCYGLDEGARRFKQICKSSQFTAAKFDPFLSLFYPPVVRHLDEPEPPQPEIFIEPVEFTAIWLPSIRVASFGIQHLKLTPEEKIEWFQSECLVVNEYLKNEGLYGLKDQLNSQQLDLQIDEIMMPFALEIAESDGNLFQHYESIKNTIHRILSLELNKQHTISLLSYIRDFIQVISNPKFANNLMEECLKKTNYFQPRKAFFIDVINLVCNSNRITNINEHLAWSTLANLSESCYWENTPEEKEHYLIEDFCRVYSGLEDKFDDPESSLNNYSQQESKLRFLDKAYSDLALMVDLFKDDINPISALEKQIIYILRLVNRINETEGTCLDPDVCIVNNLTLVIDETLAKNQYNHIKLTYSHHFHDVQVGDSKSKSS